MSDNETEMTQQDYIKKAVELADGWALCDGWFMLPGFRKDVYFDKPPDWHDDARQIDQIDLDALAAQLTRQVDALAVTIGPTYIGIRDTKEIGMPVVYERTFIGDRTKNTIKAIVDSGVLDG